MKDQLVSQWVLYEACDCFREGLQPTIGMHILIHFDWICFINHQLMSILLFLVYFAAVCHPLHKQVKRV